MNKCNKQTLTRPVDSKYSYLEIAQRVLNVCEELQGLAAFLLEQFSTEFEVLEEMNRIQKQQIESDSIPF